MDPHGRSRAYFHHLIRLPCVLVDPDEAEGEHYEVYERTLAHL